MDPAPSSACQPKQESPRAHRAVWSLIGAFFLLLGLGAWLFFRDDPAPETSDLFPRWSRAQRPDNPLNRFCRATANSALFWGIVNKNTIALYEQNTSSALPHFAEFINSPIDTWAWTDSDSMVDWFQTDPVAIPLQNIKLYLEAKHEVAQGEGRQDDALKHATQILKLGTGTARAESGLHRLDMASSLYGAGLEALKVTIRNPETPAPLLRKAQDALDQYSGPSPDDYAFALRFNHLLAIKFLEIAKAEGAEFIMQESPYPTSRVPLLKRTIKPNRTLQWRSTNTRELLSALEEGGALQAYVRGQEQIAALRPMEVNRNRWSYLADGNYAGKHFHIGWTTSTPTYLSTVMASTAIHHAMQIELALRLYQIDHHQFPASLNDLVPTYLSSVPLDPFSDAPMRWHKDKQVIYSVGTNLVDDHGDVKPFTYLHKMMDQPDIGITIPSKNTSHPPGLPNPPSPDGGRALDDY